MFKVSIEYHSSYKKSKKICFNDKLIDTNTEMLELSDKDFESAII